MIRFDVAPLAAPWRRRVSPGRAGAPAPRGRAAPASGEPPDGDDPPRGCACYASSLDLAQGLELTEVEWIDADLPAHLAVALRFA